MRTISIFGSTGSIGKTAIEFLRNYKEQWKLTCLASNENIKSLIDQAQEFNPEYVLINNEIHYHELKESLKNTDIKILAGREALIEIAKVKCDIVLMAITGIEALKPTIEAIKSGSDIALANKESIVCAGKIMLELAKQHNAKILPVDSEHNAIFQLIDGKDKDTIDKIYLTASGGSFRTYTLDQMNDIKLEDALSHPNWKMGKKITIDSSTMVNKALELIEAHYLFDMPNDKIDVVIHPESIIHGMVSFVDGSNLASMSLPDMTVSVAYALNYPRRVETKLTKLDLVKIGSLNFEKVDLKKFKPIEIARNCLLSSNKSVDCVVFNSANEAAVENFLNGKIKFLDIVRVIDFCLSKNNISTLNSLEEIYEIDKLTRLNAEKYIDDFR